MSVPPFLGAGLRFLLATVVLSYVATLGLIGTLSLAAAFSPVRSWGADVDPPETARAKAMLANLQDAFSAVADELEPAVVTVSSTKAAKPTTDSDSGDV